MSVLLIAPTLQTIAVIWLPVPIMLEAGPVLVTQVIYIDSFY